MGPLTVCEIDVPFHLSLAAITSRHEIARVNHRKRVSPPVDKTGIMERWLAESRLWMAAPNRTFVLSNSRYVQSKFYFEYIVNSFEITMSQKSWGFFKFETWRQV